MLPDLSRLTYMKNPLSGTIIIRVNCLDKNEFKFLSHNKEKIKTKIGNETNNNNKCFLHNPINAVALF